MIQIRVTLDQDEDGNWCAAAWHVEPGQGAVGDGKTPGAALADLGPALDLLLGMASRGDLELA